MTKLPVFALPFPEYEKDVIRQREMNQKKKRKFALPFSEYEKEIIWQREMNQVCIAYFGIRKQTIPGRERRIGPSR
jgi:hypothetical protein